VGENKFLDYATSPMVQIDAPMLRGIIWKNKTMVEQFKRQHRNSTAWIRHGRLATRRGWRHVLRPLSFI